MEEPITNAICPKYPTCYVTVHEKKLHGLLDIEDKTSSISNTFTTPGGNFILPHCILELWIIANAEPTPPEPSTNPNSAANARGRWTGPRLGEPTETQRSRWKTRSICHATSHPPPERTKPASDNITHKARPPFPSPSLPLHGASHKRKVTRAPNGATLLPQRQYNNRPESGKTGSRYRGSLKTMQSGIQHRTTTQTELQNAHNRDFTRHTMDASAIPVSGLPDPRHPTQPNSALPLG